jgi:uncharacterized protein (TIGR01244 family)
MSIMSSIELRCADAVALGATLVSCIVGLGHCRDGNSWSFYSAGATTIPLLPTVKYLRGRTLIRDTLENKMTRLSTMAWAVAVAISAAIPSACGSQRLTGSHPTGDVPAPVALDTHGQFQAKFASVGDDVFISGQPTERALRDLRAQGVTTVVNLRTPEEMSKSVPFDEEAVVKSLGMEYVHIPVRGTADMPYSPEALKSFAAAMASTKGKLLLHCTVAWRASHMWAAYLIQYRDMPVPKALAQGRTINLMDDMRMDGDRQPIEGFLGRSLPEIGHGKQ